MQNAASIIMDCEEAGISDIAYAKMLIELGASSGNYGLYWNSVKVDSNMKFLSDELTVAMFNKSNNLNIEFNNIKQLLSFWYKTSGKNKELGIIENLQKLAEVNKQDISTQVIALCSFIDSNMAIKIGNDIFQNIDELITFTQKQKVNDKQQYFEWVQNNQSYIKQYTECIDSKIKNCSENLLADWQNELNRRKNEEIRRKQEELARKQREEQERRQREEQERKQREERERRQREEQERRQRKERERKQREEQERRQREEQERRQREELERKQREEQERRQREERERKQREEQERKQLKELQEQTYKDFLAIIKTGIRKGMIIPFGSYPQKENGCRVPIEWLVLDVKKPSLTNRLFNRDNKIEALLVSRYGLDSMPYNDDRTVVTWEDCDLRKWLNNDFIKSAFSEEEVKRIKFSELKNEDNHEYGTKGGNDTKDRIFCLSITEAKQYFSSEKDRQCRPTAYARNKGAYVNNSNSCCAWWLRSPGYNQIDAAIVLAVGALRLSGSLVDNDLLAVRPALWIICNL